jgi:hypothetical protein
VSSKIFRIAQLDDAVDRVTFKCGTEALDDYLHTQVSQDIRRRVTACFTAVEMMGVYSAITRWLHPALR